MNTYSMAVAKKIILLVPSPMRGGLGRGLPRTKSRGQSRALGSGTQSYPGFTLSLPKGRVGSLHPTNLGIRSKDLTQLATAFLIICLVGSVWADNKSKTVKSEPVPIQNIAPKEKATPTAYEIPWTSINGGGELASTSTNYKIRASTAQSVIGESQSANYKMGIGFWYGEGLFCTAKPGDVDGNRSWTLTDIVGLVNMVFKGATKPAPLCRTDCNGSGGNPNLTDIVCLVNKVFKGGPNPPPTGVCCL